MTAKNLYNAVLIELNKENAPNILLEDFNYFANKAINNYINKRYNIYDISQQTTDDLRVLKSSAILKPTHVNAYEGFTTLGVDRLATYEVVLPSDYLHLLNCICVYKVKKTYDCYNRGQSCVFPAKRLTADMYSQVVTNYWNKPTYKNPYYYIHNVNKPSGEEYKVASETDIEETFSGYTYTTTPTNPYDWKPKVTEAESSPDSPSSSSSYSSSFTNLNISDDYILSGETILGEQVWAKMDEDCIKVVKSKALTQDIHDEEYRKSFKEAAATAVAERCDSVVTLIRTNNNWEVDQTSEGTEEEEEVELINLIKGSYLEELKKKLESMKAALIPKLGEEINGTDSSRNFISGYRTDETKDPIPFGKDGNENVIIQGSGLPKSIKIGDDYVSNVERGASLRYGNVSEVRLEIRYGTDNRVFELVSVYVDYIKAPQNIRLTQMEIDQTEDTSQMLEYPDYVCQEIINELVHLIMENISDQRLQTHPVVSQSIANPAQAQTPEAAG